MTGKQWVPTTINYLTFSLSIRTRTSPTPRFVRPLKYQFTGEAELSEMSKVEGMDCVYRDPRAPVEARIKDVLSRMTLQEKVGQMTQIERGVATPDAIKDLSIGTSLSPPLSLSGTLNSHLADSIENELLMKQLKYRSSRSVLAT